MGAAPSSGAGPDSGGWEAYVTTEVRIDVPGGAIRVFPAPPPRASGPYPDPAGRPISVITAHNPHGQVVDPEVNDREQQRLEAELTDRGLEWWPAAGADPSWTHVEQSVAIPGLSEADARELGARHDQEAIFVLTPASRKVIDCVTGRRSITGWVIAAEADLAADEFEQGLENELDHLVGAHGPDPRGWAVVVLGESLWSPQEGPGGEYLLRMDHAYVIYETDGAEWGWDYLDVPDDESAIAAFNAAVGED